MKTEENEFNALLVKETDVLYATFKTNKLEEMQGYLCLPIEDLKLNGETQLTPYSFTSFSITGKAIVYNGNDYERTKDELLNFFPEYEKLTRQVTNSNVLQFIIYSGEGVVGSYEDEDDDFL